MNFGFKSEERRDDLDDQNCRFNALLLLLLAPLIIIISSSSSCCCNSKVVPLQAWSGPGGSGKLRFPDYMTTAQDGGRLPALRTILLYPQKMLLVLIYVRG